MSLSPRGARLSVSLAIFLALTVWGSSVGAPTAAARFINAMALILAFLLPAQFLERPRDLTHHAGQMAGWLVAVTVLWDIATSFVRTREFLSEWWLVYPSGVVGFGLLLLVHALLVRLLAGKDGGVASSGGA